MSSLPPGAILLLGALVIPLLRGKARPVAALLLTVLSLGHLLMLGKGVTISVTFFSYTLTVCRVDELSFVFGLIFHIAAILGAIFALHEDDPVQHTASLIYVGSAIAAVFAGDFITLFVCWELTAVSSVFLIWARRTPASYRAGMRYLVVQVASGVLLLAGAVLHYLQARSLAFTNIGLSSTASWFVFTAFGIKCAFPLLHNWLQDAYPHATPTGTVFLSAFTTKLAIYALARAFPGTPMLVWIGAVMTVFPIFFAVIENDLRRTLAYSLNNQLGFMVVGIGLAVPGTPYEKLALNGACAHAFAHILYKALLFMSMGAVLHRAGTVKASEIGGLYKSMPLTAAFCLVGSAAISAFPGFSGFTTKSMILDAAGVGHYTLTSIVLLFASAGVLHHSGIKIPYHGFFAHDTGFRCKEAPVNMLVAMGLTAALCIGLGLHPAPLYRLLPYPAEALQFHAYAGPHLVSQFQLLLFALMAWLVLKKFSQEPPELRSTNLDTDWVYRRLGPAAWTWGLRPALEWFGRAQSAMTSTLTGILFGDVQRTPKSLSAEMAVAVAIGMLFVYLAFNLFR
jgi:multicomponent Na+:H+ antiporter subunit D